MKDNVTVKFPRADGGYIEFRRLKGNHSGRIINIAVLVSDDEEAALIFEKYNELGGGAAGVITVVDNTTKNTCDITMQLEKDDTLTLPDKCFISIKSTSTEDEEDHKTLATGWLLITPSGKTDASGMPLPIIQYLPIKAESFELEHFIKVIDDGAGNKSFAGSFFPTKGLTEIDENGDIMPVQNVIDVVDEQFELDGNGDLMPLE